VEWNSRVDKGAILILEGESSLADMFGFRRGKENVRVNSLTDVHRPKLAIVWRMASNCRSSNCPRALRFSRANAGLAHP